MFSFGLLLCGSIVVWRMMMTAVWEMMMTDGGLAQRIWHGVWCGVVSLVVGNGLVEVVVELADCRDPIFYLLITL